MATEPLILVPARGGSVGVPRKCARFLGGKPLLWWTLEKLEGLGRVAVLTDDDEIALLAQRKAVEVIRDEQPTSNTRPVSEALEKARATLDPLSRHHFWMAVQPTSPFLNRTTIGRCLALAEMGYQVRTVADDRHVRFEGTEAGAKLATPWATRQTLPPAWRITGGCFVARLGRIDPVHLVPVAGAEALDIDTPADWAAAEFYAERLSIAYRVDGGGPLGLGHVYRALTLLGHRVGQDAVLYMDGERYPEGVEIVRAAGLDVEDHREFEHSDADVVIAENRSPPEPWVQEFQRAGQTVVCIEDRLTASADLIVNDLDGPPMDGPQLYRGPRYAVVRDEFLTVSPQPLVDRVRRVVLSFGGTDPANLTSASLSALHRIETPLDITVIVGPGHPEERELPLRSHHEVRVVRHPALLSAYVEGADLAITSCGRTLYELMACQIPTVGLPQNTHEQHHAALSFDCGVWAVPVLGKDMEQASLAALFQQAMALPWRMHARARMGQLDLRHGAERFWELVRAKVTDRKAAIIKEVV